jgi:hypothetical protein
MHIPFRCQIHPEIASSQIHDDKTDVNSASTQLHEVMGTDIREMC